MILHDKPSSITSSMAGVPKKNSGDSWKLTDLPEARDTGSVPVPGRKIPWDLAAGTGGTGWLMWVI